MCIGFCSPLCYSELLLYQVFVTIYLRITTVILWLLFALIAKVRDFYLRRASKRDRLLLYVTLNKSYAQQRILKNLQYVPTQNWRQWHCAVSPQHLMNFLWQEPICDIWGKENLTFVNSSIEAIISTLPACSFRVTQTLTVVQSLGNMKTFPLGGIKNNLWPQTRFRLLIHNLFGGRPSLSY